MSTSSRGKRNRQRGQEHERSVAKIYAELMDVDARRGLQGQGEGRQADVEGVPLLRIECKRSKGTASARAALRQLAADAAKADDDRLLVVHLHDDGAGQRPATRWVALPEDDWFAIIEEWWQYRRRFEEE